MAGERIMIVEDNERNIKLLRDLLGRTATARSRRVPARRRSRSAVRSALTWCSWTSSYRGWTASLRCASYASLRETAATPVIAVTAFAMKDDRERLLAAGFDGYVEKPIDIRQLPAQLSALLAPSGGAQP